MRAGTVVRGPNHLGDVVMALPALRASGGADVLVARWLVPILEMAREAEGAAAGIGDILPLDRGARGLIPAVRRVRAGRYGRGILLTPSLSSALIFYLGGVRERVGVPTDARGALLTVKVAPPVPGTHRAASYMRLISGGASETTPALRLAVPERHRERWRRIAGEPDGPLVGVFPGSNAPSRRWEPDSFAELVRRLTGQGARVAVFGGPAEGALARHVSGGRALEVTGRGDLPLLAAGLADCAVLVTNDSGPMHLAAAVGTRTVAIAGPSDMRVTGPMGEGHAILQAEGLPCVPCGLNECPRRGAGYRLPEAERECMRLVPVEQVESTVLRHLSHQRS